MRRRTSNGSWRAVLVSGGLLTVSLLAAGCSAGLSASDGEGTGAQAIGGPVGAAPRPRQPAPEFALPLLDGSRVLELAELRGQVVVLNFWASWCAPCRAEAPALGAISRAFADKGVTFVGVAIQDTLEDSQAFVRRYGVPYVNVADARGEASFSYAVAGLPSTFLIDREGRLVRRWVGPLAEKQLVAAIEDLQS